jgi:cytochrome c oxidase subunit 2
MIRSRIKNLSATLLGALLVLLSGGAALAAPESNDVQPESGWGLPRDASVDGFGSEIDWLINITTVFVTILFVIMCIWMLYAVFKHNQSHKAEYDHGNSKHSVKVALIISAVIFFIVDGNLWFKSTKDTNRDGGFWNHANAEAQPDALRIEVNAHQWAWDLRYAGPDGKFNTQDDIVTLNEMKVPADTPVLLQLASTDVIHSFYLPNFRVKQDAMPGMINRLWFRAKDLGHYDIACAQHCGVNHYKMKGKLTVLTKQDFAAWLADASKNAQRGYDPEDKEAHWGWEWKKI